MKKISAIAIVIAISGVLLLTFHFAEAQPTARLGAATLLTIVSPNTTLIVTVLDASNNNPIQGASVRVYNITSEALIISGTTNSSGKFQVESLVAGNYSVGANKTGYNTSNASATLFENATTEVNITLSPIGGIPPIEIPSGGGRIAPLATLVIMAKKPGDVLTVFQGETLTFVIVVQNSGDTLLRDVRLVIEGFPEIPLERRVVEQVVPPPGRETTPAFIIPVRENPLVNETVVQSGLIPGTTGALLFQAQTNYNVFTITPEIIDEIPPGVRKSFFVEMSVPLETPVGNYTLLARATSKETTFVKPILLEVLPAEKKPAVLLLADEIEFLRRNINAIYNEALYLKEKGGDVSDAVSFLILANKTLDKAVEFKDFGDINSARSQIETAKTYIRTAAELLSRVKIPYLNILQIAIFLSVVAFALLITVIMYLRHEQKKIYTKLIDILYDIKRARGAG